METERDVIVDSLVAQLIGERNQDNYDVVVSEWLDEYDVNFRNELLGNVAQKFMDTDGKVFYDARDDQPAK